MTSHIVLALVAASVLTGCVATATARPAYKSTATLICESRHERGRLAMIESIQLIDACVITKNRRSHACTMFVFKVDSLNFQIGQSTACTEAGYFPQYPGMLELSKRLSVKAKNAKKAFGS